MEITVVSDNVLKLRFKQTSILVTLTSADLSNMKKAVEGDAVVILSEATSSTFPKVSTSRLVIYGAGEYEIGGIKISGVPIKNKLAFFIGGDKIDLFVSPSPNEAFDKKKEAAVALFYTTTPVSESLVTDLAPSYLVLYGEKASETAKEFGKEGASNLSKLTVAKEKLPEEMEVVVLQ